MKVTTRREMRARNNSQWERKMKKKKKKLKCKEIRKTGFSTTMTAKSEIGKCENELFRNNDFKTL